MRARDLVEMAITSANKVFDKIIGQELFPACSMHGTTTGKDIFVEVRKTLQNYKLEWKQLRGVTVDGWKNITGVWKGAGGAYQDSVGRFPNFGCSVHTLHHYTSASTLWETTTYILSTETTRFGCELH
ncbi:unnamed protein product [Lepeophtheirus salmonis]|uniref:(salmon louse) hypothetical protein n=1 Tax=Lepeophtheirus salmonis TaxID=72036 RepID=A0A7R8D1R5_LEPSM|nr:unnamed protein product [Lepeophtheirus salmonis]CAF2998208.1 unnamed protein product [Lepeophtheirus salmonis]